MKKIIIALFCLSLISCATDHTHIPVDAGNSGTDFVLLRMCSKPENRQLYQCIELCKEWICIEPTKE